MAVTETNLDLNVIQAVCIFKKVLWKFYRGQLEVRYMSDLVPVIPNRELWFVQVPDSWNCLGLEQDVRCWVEVLSHIVFLRFQSKPTIWSRTSEYTRYVLDEIKQWPDTFWSHLYPMHGSTLIIADILFLSTSILRAADPVLRVPSGQTHTKNLSTHLEKEGFS